MATGNTIPTDKAKTSINYCIHLSTAKSSDEFKQFNKTRYIQFSFCTLESKGVKINNNQLKSKLKWG